MKIKIILEINCLENFLGTRIKFKPILPINLNIIDEYFDKRGLLKTFWNELNNY